MNWVRLTAAILLVLLAAASAGAQLTIKGDAAAFQEVQEARKRLHALRSYRTKLTSAGSNSTLIFERVKPDRSRSIQYLDNLIIESIGVAGEIRIRMIRSGKPGVWECASKKPPPQPSRSNPDAKGEVTVTRLGELTIDGAKVRKFLSVTLLQGVSNRQYVYVLVKDRLVRREERLAPRVDKVEHRWDYYDFNAPITIELPPCQRVLRP